jgi:hypothetical protein
MAAPKIKDKLMTKTIQRKYTRQEVGKVSKQKR